MTATTTAHPLLLTDDQVRSFDEQGYLVLRQRVPAALVQRLRTASERWVADAGDEGRSRPGDWLFAQRPAGRVLFRVDYLHDKGEPASLELLGSPAVLGVAQSLAGPDLLPTYESLVLKAAGDAAPVPWHQDAVHPRRFRMFNVGVYLDDSRAGAGALRVVPGSHLRRTDACALADRHGRDLPGAVEVEVDAGDVLVHDDMLVHGSPPVAGAALRRTAYLEFRPASGVLRDGPWSPDWVRARMRLLPLALRAHAARFPDEEPWPWDPGDELRPAPVGDDEAELRVVHGVHTPGEWCSAG